ncbi:MAG TPA: hypothetical protein VEL11_05345 [Candidatus Bathyarchaeia archaeon]|nr:hypothetical protein [Candidatus Bathyarchaeia archaeon]
MSNSHSGYYGTKDKSEKDSSEIEKIKSLSSRQATCKLCGLTARNERELEDHVRHAHKTTSI